MEKKFKIIHARNITENGLGHTLEDRQINTGTNLPMSLEKKILHST